MAGDGAATLHDELSKLLLLRSTLATPKSKIQTLIDGLKEIELDCQSGKLSAENRLRMIHRKSTSLLKLADEIQ